MESKNPIKIHNLTPHQKKMLDKMWNLKSIKEYDDWGKTLGKEDQMLKKSLEQLLVVALLDVELETYLTRNGIDPYPEANQILSKFRLNAK
jgi:hypothetical protein